MARPALLDEALEAAGGRERWHAARWIRARVRSGGMLPRTRMSGNRFADYRLTIEVERPYAVLDPFPEPGSRGVFEDGAVRIEDADGQVLEQRENARSAFFGRGGLRRNLRWDALDSTYFAGYAMWNYLTTPLLLTREDIQVEEGESWSGEGERWRRLDAAFPPGLDTHSREQSFFFDDRGLEVRHDYTAEVVARTANGAHYCAEHRSFDGLVFPTRRRVLPRRRNLRSWPFPTIVSLDISEVTVEAEGEVAL